MPWDKEAEKGLPPQHHREPASLRRDIVDELTDHLACAAEREADAGHKDETIRTRVLDQFGDPAAIARNLWWGAMKETIMRDRIQFALVIILCLSVLGFMGLFYKQMQTTNRAMIAALEDRSTVLSEKKPSLTVHVHRGTADGPPAEGIMVRVSGRAFNEEKSSIEDKTNSDGMITFGPIRSDSYDLGVHDLMTDMWLQKKVTLFDSDETKVIHIVAPDTTPKDIQITLPEMAYTDPNYQAVYVALEEKFEIGSAAWNKHHEIAIDNGELIGVVDVRKRPHGNIVLGLTGSRSYSISKAYIKKGSQTRFFGNSITVHSIAGVFKEHDSDAYQYFTVSANDENHPVKDINVNYSGALQSFDITKSTEFRINIPSTFKRSYPLFTRHKMNTFGDLPNEFKWFPFQINQDYPDYVVHSAALVGNFHPAKLNEEKNFDVFFPERPTSTWVNSSSALLFQLQNMPRNIPKNAKVVLCLLRPDNKIFDVNQDLGLYPIKKPIDFLDIRSEKNKNFEINPNFGLNIDASFFEESESRVWYIDVTDWLNHKNFYSYANAAILRWNNQSGNYLGFSNNRLNSEQRPVWVVLQPYADVIP
jgi:5-hydroxyisourate hydrolase-like protein (transthyretin family)